MYFHLGSPNSRYQDFIEFTVGPDVFNGNTTRVEQADTQGNDPARVTTYDYDHPVYYSTPSDPIFTPSPMVT